MRGHWPGAVGPGIAVGGLRQRNRVGDQTGPEDDDARCRRGGACRYDNVGHGNPGRRNGCHCDDVEIETDLPV